MTRKEAFDVAMWFLAQKGNILERKITPGEALELIEKDLGIKTTKSTLLKLIGSKRDAIYKFKWPRKVVNRKNDRVNGGAVKGLTVMEIRAILRMIVEEEEMHLRSPKLFLMYEKFLKPGATGDE